MASVAGVVLGLLALGTVFLGSGSSSATTSVQQLAGGSVSVAHTEIYPWLFAKGILTGDQTVLSLIKNSAVIQIGPGANQAAWTNNTGRVVHVRYGQVIESGTSSSSINVYVGTSTATTFASDYSAPWAQFIDGASFPTSTSATTWTADNITSHKSTYPGTLDVQPNNSVVIQAQEKYACKTTGGTCETATSTNRGWTSLTLPFDYSY